MQVKEDSGIHYFCFSNHFKSEREDSIISEFSTQWVSRQVQILHLLLGLLFDEWLSTIQKQISKNLKYLSKWSGVSVHNEVIDSDSTPSINHTLATWLSMR